MYGAVVSYKESNVSEENNCCYKFLLDHYCQKQIKKLSVQKLLDIFNETNPSAGVTTLQLEQFSIKYRTTMYALDIDLKVFHKYVPPNKNSNIDVLMFVCANNHMYPIILKSARDSIVARERLKECNRPSAKPKQLKQQYNHEKEVVINPLFEELQKLQNVNVIYTNVETLLPLVIFLFKTEQCFYDVNSHNGCILSQKAHSACLGIKNDYDFAVYTIFNEIEEYKGNLKTGFFYIETESYFPLRGNGWYSQGILRYAIEVGVSFKILYEIIPSYSLKNDYFVNFVNRTFEKCINPKKQINALVGCFGKKSSTSQKDKFTVSLSDASRHFFQDNSVYFNYPECPELYHIVTSSTTALTKIVYRFTGKS
jgi:hypothetical protein